MKFAIIIFIAFIATCCNQNNTTIINSYEKMHNSHDIEGTMVLYDDDIKFELKGTWTKSGKEKIRELAEWDCALNSNLKIKTLDIREDSIFCKVTEENDWFKAVGIAQIIHDPTIFVVRNGRIKNIIANPSADTGKEIGLVINSIYSWSQVTKDSSINELIKDGEFIYSAKSAEKWITLFEKWDKYKAVNKVD